MENVEEEQEGSFFIIDGKEVPDEEGILSALLNNNVVFANEFYYSYEKDGKSQGKTTVLFVICNDIFGWAVADSEDLPNSEIGNLYKMYIADSEWGAAKWCALRRNWKPQKPCIDLMKQSGSWDERMEALPPNEWGE